ncbi:hypothetical protein HZB94_03980 [Candidatus Falkowbacteria bacterium]|nr:hypothetical protein [Candidatus Falkowbacteria bacterium]
MPITKVIANQPFICMISGQRKISDGIVKIKAVAPEGNVFIMVADEVMALPKGTHIVVRKFQEINDDKRRLIRPIEWSPFSRKSRRVFTQPEIPQTQTRTLQSSFPSC